MTPHLNLRDVKPFQCQKPGCMRRPIERHHKGSERMWLRHFRHKRRTKRFIEFRERYYAYRNEDTCGICTWHHAEISALNLELIQTSVVQAGYVPCRDWTWDQAEALMAKLRATCDTWLTVPTPGIDPKSVVRPKQSALRAPRT